MTYKWRDPRRPHWTRMAGLGCLTGPGCGLCMTRVIDPEPLTAWEIRNEFRREITRRVRPGRIIWHPTRHTKFKRAYTRNGGRNV